MVAGFGIISQGATLMLPGKDHLMVYSCQGKMPKNIEGEPYKANVAFNVVALLSVLCYITTVVIPFLKQHRKKVSVEPLGAPSMNNFRKEHARPIFRYFLVNKVGTTRI